jgi:hypothetical protein
VTNPRQGYDRDVNSYPRLLAWREHSQLIEPFAGYAFRRAVVTGIGDPEQLLVVRATPEFFGVVQTEPVAGYASAVGQILRLDSVPYSIIGVLPPSFQFPARDLDAWVPLQPSAEERSSGAFWLQTVGRLKPGVSLAQAQQEMTAIAARLGAERPSDRELGVAATGWAGGKDGSTS